ncbi:hypothetical protein [Pseudomonas paeninsulae]|uniref:hypothetical protein n=1 Tax=Pseudomonas paeninsulae TaxID=3110772 RepID=UPI002D76AA69|nr:hypothetical protein [Pseudomonas sp. IT1137]
MCGLLLLLSVALVGAGQAKEQAASQVLHNARIYTVNAEQPWAEALAIGEQGEILAVGRAADMDDYSDEGTEFVDLKDRLVPPCFEDAEDDPEAGDPARRPGPADRHRPR